MSTGRLGAGDTAIQPTILDAKGDLIVATAADTPARLAVGSANQVLTVDSSTATGLKWATPAAGGKVLQVVSGTTSTQTTIASTSLTDTGLSVSITPTATTSKVLIIVSQYFRLNETTTGRVIGIGALLRGSTNITIVGSQNINFAELGIQTSSTFNTPNLDVGGTWGIVYLDSPNTTSATTYKTQASLNDTTSRNLWMNTGGSPSYIMALEIGA